MKLCHKLMIDLTTILDVKERDSNPDLFNNIDLKINEISTYIEELANQVHHWKSNHDEMVRRLKIFTDRDDLPVDRTEAYKELVRLQEENHYLKLLNLKLTQGATHV